MDANPLRESKLKSAYILTIKTDFTTARNQEISGVEQTHCHCGS